VLENVRCRCRHSRDCACARRTRHIRACTHWCADRRSAFGGNPDIQPRSPNDQVCPEADL